MAQNKITIADLSATGSPSSSTFLRGDNSWQSPTASVAWGGITGTLSDQTDLQSALNLKANLASPTFTGTVSGITATMVGLGNVDNTSDATKNSATATLTNKRIQPRSSTAASGDITPDLATANIWQRTAISGTIAINAPTGSPVLGETLVFMLLDNGTSRTLNWNSAYTTRPMGAALPTATTISKQLLVTAQYNGTTWLCLSVEEI
jgi:hypothetical protein